MQASFFLYPFSLLTAFAASSPKGTPLSYAGNFTSTAKSRPLGQTLPDRGEMSRQRQSGERVAKPQALTEGVSRRADVSAGNQRGSLPLTAATPPVKRQFWKIRRFSRIAKKNNFSSEYAQSTAERIPNRSLIKKAAAQARAAAFLVIPPVQPCTPPHRLRSCRSGSVPRHGRSRIRGAAGRGRAPWRESPAGWAGG